LEGNRRWLEEGDDLTCGPVSSATGKRRKGEGDADRRAPRVSDSERENGRRLGAERGRAAGPAGRGLGSAHAEDGGRGRSGPRASRPETSSGLKTERK
jgi:hypothetical protein